MNRSPLPSTAADEPQQAKRLLLQLGVASSVLVLDQLTKTVAGRQECGDLVCPQRNSALMLGVGSSSAISVGIAGTVGVLALVLWTHALDRVGRAARLGLAVAFAGVVGNLIDRVALGSVRDFISTPFHVLLNVADLAILLGLATCSLTCVHRRPNECTKGGESA